MNKRPEPSEWEQMIGENLKRLFYPPDAAQRDRSGWSYRHFDAVVRPTDPFESAMVGLLGGWLLYADVHRQAYLSAIGEDGVLGPEWAAIGAGLRGLLNGHLGRLDAGTLDCILCETLQANGRNPKD